MESAIKITDTDNGNNNAEKHVKQFRIQDSLLTKLFEINHIRSIYNFFLVSIFLMYMRSAIYEYLDSGRILFSVPLFAVGFANFHIALLIWVLMMLIVLQTYIGLLFWAKLRIKLQQESFKCYLWDRFWVTLFIIYLAAFLILPAMALQFVDLGLASSFSVLMEQVRLIMKSYAFVRSNIGSELQFNTSSFPKFNHFIYFLFAPTLVYSGAYPRTQLIKWKYVMTLFTEIILLVFFGAVIFENHFYPSVKNIGKEPMELKTLISLLFDCMMWGVLFQISLFYLFIHCWMNACAEILKFGDRCFYKDWWNTTNTNDFFRAWNVLVQDWLYIYVYRDLYDNVTRNKLLSLTAVFILSATFHEYILTLMLGFCYPVMLAFFFFCVVFILIIPDSKTIGNILMWFVCCIGVGIMITLYFMEYFARINNCQSSVNSSWDFFVPRMWTCEVIKY